jgi:hypothetical protein
MKELDYQSRTAIRISMTAFATLRSDVIYLKANDYGSCVEAIKDFRRWIL